MEAGMARQSIKVIKRECAIAKGRNIYEKYSKAEAQPNE